MDSLKIKLFVVSSMLALTYAISDPSTQFSPVHHGISPLPFPFFPHHVSSPPHSNYHPKPLFPLHESGSSNSLYYKPSPIVDDYTPVYKPKPKPIYHPNPKTYNDHGSTNHSRHDESPSFNYKTASYESHNEIDDYQPRPKKTHKTTTYKETSKPYAFNYGVHDEYFGTNFGHSETSDGTAVRGSYTVALPDGRLQRVTYTADHDNGYQAQVTYEGEAQFPDYTPKKHVTYDPHHIVQSPPKYTPEPKYKPGLKYSPEPKYKPELKYTLEPKYAPEPRYTPGPKYAPNPKYSPDQIYTSEARYAPTPHAFHFLPRQPHHLPSYNPLHHWGSTPLIH